MRGFRHLDIFDREEIEKMYNENSSVADIAQALGYTMGTIYRELRRGYNGKVDHNGHLGYSAEVANAKALQKKLERWNDDAAI